MIKLILLITFLTFNLKAETTSGSASASLSSTEAGVSAPAACPECHAALEMTALEKEGQYLRQLSKGVVDFSNVCKDSKNPAQILETDTQSCKILKFSKSKYDEYGKNCAQFFNDKDGKLGRLSILLTKQISSSILNEKDSPFLKSYPDLVNDQVCPGYEKMEATSKVAFWTWFFEIMGFFETSCNPNSKNSANDVPNGPAVGLFQLEYQKSLRKWRGPNCAVDEKTILTAEGNTACAVDEMKRLLKKNGVIFGQRDLKTGKLTVPNYWHALNQLPKKLAGNKNEVHNRFARYMPRFPLCKK